MEQPFKPSWYISNSLNKYQYIYIFKSGEKKRDYILKEKYFLFTNIEFQVNIKEPLKDCFDLSHGFWNGSMINSKQARIDSLKNYQKKWNIVFKEIDSCCPRNG